MRILTLYLLILTPLFSCQIKEEKNETSDLPGQVLNQTQKQRLEKEVVCFVYHRFGDKRYPSTNVSLADFENHLKWLTNNNFKVLTLSDAIDYLSSKEAPWPTAVITIDDGYRSFFESGLPLLQKYKMPATLYINTETVGAGDYMDWPQLATAAQNGVEIGNHTHTHAYFLNQLSKERNKNFAHDLETSQRLIEQNLSITPTTFAYPYGEFDDEMKAIVKGAGFKGAAAQNSGVVNSATDKYQIPRFPMSESYASGFVEKVQMQSLAILNQSPTQTIISQEQKQPLLKVTISTQTLLIDQMQCFVQGTTCKLNVVKSNDGQMTITLQSTSSISERRRTLYTLTAPDSLGNWHWYSHLWVNPAVK